MLKCVLVISMVFSVSGTLQAQAEPDQDPASPHAFKGLPLGSPESVMHTRYPWGCDDNSGDGFFIWLYDRNCTPMKDNRTGKMDTGADFGTYAGYGPRFYTLYYWHDQLSFVRLVMSSTFFEGVTAALQQRYGPPSKMVVDTVQNRAGGKFQQEIYRWERPLSAITAMRYGTDLEESEVHYELRSWEQADSVARSNKEKQRSRDM
jgi:hypothetical protein